MKQKLTIMKQRVDLSDEEISSYMNFDSLRKKQMELDAKKRRMSSALKWLVTGLLLISSTIYYLTFKDTDTDAATIGVQQIEPESQAPQHISEPGIIQDSIEKKNQNTKEAVTEQTVKPVKEHVQIEKNNTSPSDNTPVESIYIQAEPIDGYASLYAYLNTHLQYPKESLSDSIQGVQTVSFIISVDGKPEKVQFVESLGIPFEKESKRLIESMPAWKPATLNGRPVPSKLVLPLTFQIQKIKAKE